MTEPLQNHVVEKSDALDDRIAIELNRLERGRRLTNWMIRLLAVVLGMETLLAVAVAFFGWQAIQTQQVALAAQETTYSACLAGNEARTGQRQLWEFILLLPPPQNQSPAQTAQEQKQSASLRIYVNRVFANRKC
jgi:hypothetical protein